MSSLGVAETTELVIDRIRGTRNNIELVKLITESDFAENLRSKMRDMEF